MAMQSASKAVWLLSAQAEKNDEGGETRNNIQFADREKQGSCSEPDSPTS
jgi:hypothetical protein